MVFLRFWKFSAAVLWVTQVWVHVGCTSDAHEDVGPNGDVSSDVLDLPGDTKVGLEASVADTGVVASDTSLAPPDVTVVDSRVVVPDDPGPSDTSYPNDGRYVACGNDGIGFMYDGEGYCVREDLPTWACPESLRTRNVHVGTAVCSLAAMDPGLTREIANRALRTSELREVEPIVRLDGLTADGVLVAREGEATRVSLTYWFNGDSSAERGPAAGGSEPLVNCQPTFDEAIAYRDGQKLRLFAWSRLTCAPNQPTEPAEGEASTECTFDPLPRGSYTIVYLDWISGAEHSVPFEVGPSL